MQKPSPIVQRCKFNSCHRKQGQSVSDIIAELNEYCDNGSALSDDRIQKRLLTTDFASLDLKKAKEICQAMEAANRDIQDLTTAESSLHDSTAHVNKVTFTHTCASNRVVNQVGLAVTYGCLRGETWLMVNMLKKSYNENSGTR